MLGLIFFLLMGLEVSTMTCFLLVGLLFGVLLFPSPEAIVSDVADFDASGEMFWAHSITHFEINGTVVGIFMIVMVLIVIVSVLFYFFVL